MRDNRNMSFVMHKILGILSEKRKCYFILVVKLECLNEIRITFRRVNSACHMSILVIKHTSKVEVQGVNGTRSKPVNELSRRVRDMGTSDSVRCDTPIIFIRVLKC